jgi:PhnB protein
MKKKENSNYGAFTDQFGVKWMVNCQLEEG